MTFREETDLDDWLARIARGRRDRTLVDWSFPNEMLKSAYLDTIADRSEDEVRLLLRRFLITNGSLGSDGRTIESLMWTKEHDPELYERLVEREFYRRLLSRNGRRQQPWEGITWVLDLLPSAPGQAVDVLRSYFSAHAQLMPDGRIYGMEDAMALIRAMWIGNPRSAAEKRRAVFDLGHEHFEHLIEALFAAMGFRTRITPRTRDGGRDIIVTRDVPGSKEVTFVECKLYRRVLGDRAARDLLGAVSAAHATKGVLVAPGGFSGPLKRFVKPLSTIELIDWPELLLMLDEHLGSTWARDIDRHIAYSLRRTGRDG